MGNFQTDWGAMDSLLDDNGDPTEAPDLDSDAKRRVQKLCVAMADYDKAQAREFMDMLGIRPPTPSHSPRAPLRELNQNVARGVR